jgi:hypothetical protein
MRHRLPLTLTLVALACGLAWVATRERGNQRAVCNGVQRIACDAALSGRDRRLRLKLDRDFPGSAAIGVNSCQLEGLALAKAWGFESPLPHQLTRF